MKRLLFIGLFIGALSGAADTLWTEGFEGATMPPDGWTQNSVDQSSTYAHTGSSSAKLGASADYLVTPLISSAQNLVFWTYTTSADPDILAEYASDPNGPWTAVSGSPFSGSTEQWNERSVDLSLLSPVYIRFSKSGTGSLYIDDVSVEGSSSGTPVNNPPVIDPVGDQSVTVSNSLSFAVTAADAEGDSIVLSAADLPDGAVFDTVTDSGSVTGQFYWNSAAPAGTYSLVFQASDGSDSVFETVTITVTNGPAPPPLTGTAWNVVYNLPQQSSSGTAYPDQFKIRDALVERVDALENGDSAILSTFTFSAEEGAGVIMNAIASALDRGALIRFIADGDINIGTVYGGTHSLLTLTQRADNPLELAVDDSTSGIMHDKLGLFDYGGSNQWVFITSWNFTLAASSSQWNIALEARSPSLYSVYASETAELLAGRFHDDPSKSHAHDGSTFELDGSWGTDFARFAPYPDATEGGDNAESDITNLIAQAQSEIVFALNKLNRAPIRDALIDAADRGVIIKGVLPKSDTDEGNVSASIYRDLTDSANYATTNRVQFLPAYAKADYSALDSGESDLIHAKYMVIDPDSTHAVVIHGSANWTSAALVNDNDNDENIVFLRHNEIAAQFHEHFQRITGTGAFSEGNSTLAEWNFDDGDQIADGGISVNQQQTVVRVPAPSGYSYTSGALSCSGWNSGADTAYWETSLATTAHTDIKVSSVQLASSTGPSDFKLQYKISSGGTYADVPYSDVHVPEDGNGVLTRVLLPDECNDQSVVFLRWIMASDTAANGGDIGSSGAGRIDDIVIIGTAHNQPPVIDPVGDQNAFENQSLSFEVTASDPVDGDAVTLSAANLPTGAVFTNGVFCWDNVAPVGVYAVTFNAGDKDGLDSKTVTINIMEKPLLLISEVADPSGEEADAYRFVELYNAGTNTIDLTAGGWYLSKQVNGGTWYDIALTGSVASESAWVIAYGADDFELAYGFAPDQESGYINGNGDDAYLLYYAGDHSTGLLIDAYGEKDTDGTGTAWEYEDSRAVRKGTVLEPNEVWTASEWTVTSGATTNSMTPGVHGPMPEFEGLENAFVFSGDDLSLTVTAANNVREDVITLSAASLPDGAVFHSVTGTNTVSSTLTWNRPDDGTYTAAFAASGEVGTTTESITITVSSTSEIDGKFYGWKNDTIVKLRNGQFWQNTGGSGEALDSPLRNPDAAVVNYLKTGKYRMTVENLEYTTVKQINVIESTVTNPFTGLYHENIYQLTDGTVWEQISFENISSSADPVTAWRWTEGGKQMMRFFDRNDAVIGTCEVKASAPPDNLPITSEIDGYFRGWKNKRVFALKNGQFWQQTSLDSSTETLYRPEVTITNRLQTGRWRMSVGDLSGDVTVQQLTNVTRTAISGYFYGFSKDNIFSLQNGSWWKQTSIDTSTSTRRNPEILVWSEDGKDYLELPDEGRCVSAEELDVHLESTVTNTFTGLHYGNMYRLASGGNWLQLSFENISTNVTEPEVMLWIDGSGTNLLARGSRDVTIGTCIVADPVLDADNDGFSNEDEILAGTGPRDADSLFALAAPTRDDSGQYVLHWDAVEGRIYTIEWTPSTSEKFQTVESGIAAPQNSWTDTVHRTETSGFYRIRVQQAD
ncbi:MAG: uncharacterized protein PWQ29_1264 [Verrucomicrobiota bacterium]|nr:uncharacterized protein [Verrucomicrobiota bacterium]